MTGILGEKFKKGNGVSKLIEKVKIGNQTYVVYEVPVVDRHEALAGQIRFFDSIIRIQEEQTQELKQETILHEVIHGVENFLDLEFEEGEVKQLAKGLMMVFKDNPDLMDYLKTESKELGLLKLMV